MAPVLAARKPVESNCPSSCPMPSAPMISGSATLTMVEDRMQLRVPVSAVSVTSQRKAGP